MIEYHAALLSGGNVFDEIDSTDLDEIKEWAKGRGTFYDYFEQRHKPYKVMIYTYDDNGDLDPFDSYYES